MREQLGRASLEGSSPGQLRKDFSPAGRGLIWPADRPRPPFALASAADGGAGEEVPPLRSSLLRRPLARSPGASPAATITSRGGKGSSLENFGQVRVGARPHESATNGARLRWG